MRTELSTREQARRAAAGGGEQRGTARGGLAALGRGRPDAADRPTVRPGRADQTARPDQATRTRPAPAPRRRIRPPVRVSPLPRPGAPRSAAPRSAVPARPAAAARRSAGARRLGVPRTPFVLLVLGLLGGGLVCLLVINTTLGSASYKINYLQQGNTTMSQEVQALQDQIATEEAPATIEHEAYRLGMRQQEFLTYLNAGTGRISRQPNLRNVPAVPGFTP